MIVIHDYLNQRGGAEKTLETILEVFPKVKLYALIHDKEIFPSLNVQTSIVQRLPSKKQYKKYMFLFPYAVRLIKIPRRSFILSSSHAYVKNVRKPEGSLHISYCYTPIRYAWDLRDEYIVHEPFFLRPFIKFFLSYLRMWDRRGSRSVDYFIAISRHVSDRIKKSYGRDSVVIYPPVDTAYFDLYDGAREDYYLLVSRLKGYKKVDIVIEAFKRMGKQLIIIGDGSDRARLDKIAGGCANIVFKGLLSDSEVRSYYQHARAFIHPQIEDFGIAAVEAQATGTPVIAYAEGGALETVLEGKTGHFFEEQNPEALIDAIYAFEKMSFNPHVIRQHALLFDKEIFKKKIKSFIEVKHEMWLSRQSIK